jgi:hypothetical protein
VAYLDHLVIAVADLGHAAARWHEVTGIEFVRGGRHPGGTENRIGMLAGQRAYLELITVVDPAATDGWAALVRDRIGPLAWAVGTDDIDRDTRLLALRAVATGPIGTGSRRCPDGTTVTWRSSILGQPETAAWPFLIEWPVSGRGRLGVAGSPADIRLTSVTVSARNPAELAGVLAGTLGFAMCDENRASEGETAITDGEVRLTVVPSADGITGPVALRLSGTGLAGREARDPEVLDGILVGFERQRAPA